MPPPIHPSRRLLSVLAIAAGDGDGGKDWLSLYLVYVIDDMGDQRYGNVDMGDVNGVLLFGYSMSERCRSRFTRVFFFI